MKTGLITSDTSKNHDTGPGHPEQIARVSVIVENFKKLNNKNLIWKKPSKVSDDILLTTHENNYLNLVKSSFPKKGFASLDVRKSIRLSKLSRESIISKPSSPV